MLCNNCEQFDETVNGVVQVHGFHPGDDVLLLPVLMFHFCQVLQVYYLSLGTSLEIGHEDNM